MAEILLCFVSLEDLEETAAGRKIMTLTPWEEDKERYRPIKTCLDFTPDTEAMRKSVEHLPPVSEERAAFLMRGEPETTILEDAAELRDLSAAVRRDIEAGKSELAAYSRKITETFDRWREQARERENLITSIHQFLEEQRAKGS